MPTTKQRITITATGELERILDAQARLHPDLSPSALVAMLIERGHAASSEALGREALVRGLAGSQTYPAGYLLAPEIVVGLAGLSGELPSW
ncbi:hypothetical protein [Candidatus Microthrix parvicella]|uniref:hypothetical protein n=1 Tax=Candidatus Neomicrothrix parvicella TaxID=41950 RepID=UPI000382A505|nr:hypothetical protein [Candidatus Microthrix parvicella]